MILYRVYGISNHVRSNAVPNRPAEEEGLLLLPSAEWEIEGTF
jgi:hypothetical protein